MEKFIIGTLIMLVLFALISLFINWRLSKKDKYTFQETFRIQNQLIAAYIVAFFIVLMYVIYY